LFRAINDKVGRPTVYDSYVQREWVDSQGHKVMQKVTVARYA